MGDDWTDEFTFEFLPEEAITIKVGREINESQIFCG